MFVSFRLCWMCRGGGKRTSLGPRIDIGVCPGNSDISVNDSTLYAGRASRSGMSSHRLSFNYCFVSWVIYICCSSTMLTYCQCRNPVNSYSVSDSMKHSFLYIVLTICIPVYEAFIPIYSNIFLLVILQR